MNAQTKRSLATMLTGLIATLAALLVAQVLRQRACTGATGRWDAAARSCVLPSGATPSWLGGTGAYVVAAVAGVLLAVMLWRTYTFFATGGGGRRQPPG
jgi:hypothetical protein